MISEKGKELIKNADKQGLLEMISVDLGNLKLSNPEHVQIQDILSQYHNVLSVKKEKPEKK